MSVRTAGSPRATGRALREAIRSVDPQLPIERIGVLADLVEDSVARQRLYAGVVSGFGLLALLTTALGMYGLTAYTVSRRRREIGIRLALGAPTSEIRGATLGRAARLAAIGLALGMGGAWWGVRLLDAFIFDLSPGDPRVYAAAGLLLALASVGAAVAPARRAARVDPMVALRSD